MGAPDVSLTAEMNAKGVITGANQVKSAMNGLKKPSADVGRGFLAVSQATEDFAMAGMKGVLNNIPQTIGAFGGSAGLAAGASFAAVAIYVLTDRIFAMLDAMQEAKLAEFAKATFISISDFEKKTKAVNDAAKAYENMAQAMDSANEKQSAKFNADQAAYNNLYLQESKNELLEKEIEIAKSLETEDQKAFETRKARLNFERSSLQASLSLQERQIANLDNQEKAQRSVFESSQTALDIELKKRQNLESELRRKEVDISAQAKKEIANKNSPIYDPLPLKTGGVESYLQTQDRVVKQVEKKRIDSINKIRGEYKPIIENSDVQIAFLSEQTKQLEKTVNTAKSVVDSKRDELQQSRSLIESKKEQLDLEEKLKQTQEEQKRVNEVRNAARAMMANDAISSAGLLSSTGRVGGSAREAVAALGAINIQKQQLSTLKIIARNTAKRTIATAG